MKKVFTLIAVLMLLGAVSAQENSGTSKKSSFGLGSGLTIYGGYSPLSLVADDSPECLAKLNYSFDFQRCYNDSFFWGVELGANEVSTPAIQYRELMDMIHFAIKGGLRIPIAKGWEIPLQLKFGPTVMINQIKQAAEWEYFYRWGLMGGLGLGLDYMLPHICVGVSNIGFLGKNFTNIIALPDGSQYNGDDPWFTGFNLMFHAAFYYLM